MKNILRLLRPRPNGKMMQLAAHMYLDPKMILLVPDKKIKKQRQRQFPDLADRIKTSEELDKRS